MNALICGCGNSSASLTYLDGGHDKEIPPCSVCGERPTLRSPVEYRAISAEHALSSLQERYANVVAPVPMLLWCPECGERHVDVGDFAQAPHHTHACQHCGLIWRPAKIHTVGVQFLPGYKNP